MKLADLSSISGFSRLISGYKVDKKNLKKKVLGPFEAENEEKMLELSILKYIRRELYIDFFYKLKENYSSFIDGIIGRSRVFTKDEKKEIENISDYTSLSKYQIYKLFTLYIKKRVKDKEVILNIEDKISLVISKEEEQMRPIQELVFRQFFLSDDNVGLAFTTAIGKTYTYLKIALEYLSRFPDKKVVISTTQNNLISQIQKEINKFESLHLLSNHPRLIISTPQGIYNSIDKGEIDPLDVGIVIFDEIGVGAQMQTMRFHTYQIKKRLDAQNKDYRIICADATITDFDHISKEFSITKWYFGDHALFEDPRYNQGYEIIPTNEHKDISDRFSELLNGSYKKMYNYIQEKGLEDILKYLKPITSELPYIKRENYIKLQEYLEGKTDDFIPNYKRYRKVRSLLAAYKYMQDLYDILENQTYTSMLDTLRRHYKNMQKGNKWMLEYLFFDNKQDKEKGQSSLVDFAKYLSEKMKEGVWHPKVLEIQKLLLQAKKEGKKVLVLCKYLSTANQLNYISTAIWNIPSAVLKGGRGSKKKRKLQQKYIFDRFKEGDIDVIFATSVAERGLDLPDIDTVISYSPPDNVVVDLQSRGRIRKAGTMLTLYLGQAEQVKFFDNMRAIERYRELRYIYRQQTEERLIIKNEKQSLRSKFNNKCKENFFVQDIKQHTEEHLNQVVSERFYIVAIRPPSHRQKYGMHSMYIKLKDKTGIINCYYQFVDYDIAYRVYQQLCNVGHVIVNARVKKSKTKVYLICTYNKHHFAEGIIPLPESDIDMESVPVSAEDISRTQNRILGKKNVFIKKEDDGAQLSLSEASVDNTPLIIEKKNKSLVFTKLPRPKRKGKKIPDTKTISMF